LPLHSTSVPGRFPWQSPLVFGADDLIVVLTRFRRFRRFRYSLPSRYPFQNHVLLVLLVARCSFRSLLAPLPVLDRSSLFGRRRYRSFSHPSLVAVAIIFPFIALSIDAFHSGYFRFPASRYHHGITFAPITIVRYPLPGLSRRRP